MNSTTETNSIPCDEQIAAFKLRISALEAANAQITADWFETDKELTRVAEALLPIINEMRDISKNLNAGPARAALANEVAERLVVIIRGD